MHLSNAPATILDLIASEGGLPELGQLNPGQKNDLFRKLGAVQMVMQAGRGSMTIVKKTTARTLRVSPQAIDIWIRDFKAKGWQGLVDQRRLAAKGRKAIPDVTAQWFKDLIIRTQRTEDGMMEAHRQVIDQWNLWRRTGDPQWAIPGFISPPADCGKGYPAGFSYETFRKCKPTRYQRTLASQGTIASYRSLPSILSTCVGTSYLEYIFFDDEKPDVNVRVPGFDRPMVPLCFHALDRLTRFPFRPHIRLRWYDTDAQQHKTLTQKEFVWYVIAILGTEGYRTDAAGTTLIQEHGTAKTWDNKQLTTPDGYHSFEDALKAITGGHVRMDSSGLFNKPAFSELLYGPQSSGNPRFKAPIESSFHLWRTYSQMLIGQTGLNVANAPEENHGITRYEKNILKQVSALPQNIQDGIVSNYLTGVEFAHMAELIRHALANRTDHNFEGWTQMNFVEPVWRWKDDEPGKWRSRSALAALPQHLREHAASEQSEDPRLSDILPWSPSVARASLANDPAIQKLSLFDSILLLPTSWAKPVTVTSRHQIEITEELLPGEELIYLPELTTPRGRTEYLQPGEKFMAYLNPMMADTLIICDLNFAPLGTLTRNVRHQRDNNAVEEMFKQRARLKGALEAPVRRAMQPVADRRDAVHQLNKDLIAKANGEHRSETEIKAANRSAAADKAVTTRRANQWEAAAEDVFSEPSPVSQPIAESEIADWLND